MGLREYFDKATGYGVLATADATGKVNGVGRVRLICCVQVKAFGSAAVLLR
jgi:hypothetical protein